MRSPKRWPQQVLLCQMSTQVRINKSHRSSGGRGPQTYVGAISKRRIANLLPPDTLQQLLTPQLYRLHDPPRRAKFCRPSAKRLAEATPGDSRCAPRSRGCGRTRRARASARRRYPTKTLAPVVGVSLWVVQTLGGQIWIGWGRNHTLGLGTPEQRLPCNAGECRANMANPCCLFDISFSSRRRQALEEVRCV